MRPAPRARCLDRVDRLDAAVERRRELRVHGSPIGAGDEVRLVAVAGEQRGDLLVARPSEHRRPRDLVLVQLQDRQHRAVASGVEKPHALPRALERTRLRLAVADHARHQEVGVVEGRPERVSERIAQLPALVDGARGGHAHVAGDAAGRRELANEPAQAGLIRGYVRVELRVGALEVDVGDERRSAVARARDVQHVARRAADEPVEVDVDEVEGRGRAPVPEQARLDVLRAQRLPQQRVLLQVDLGDREVVRGLPVSDDALQVSPV